MFQNKNSSQTAVVLPSTRCNITINGQTIGPFDLNVINQIMLSGQVKKETFVWKSGMANWNLIENVNEVLRLIALTPPPLLSK